MHTPVELVRFTSCSPQDEADLLVNPAHGVLTGACVRAVGRLQTAHKGQRLSAFPTPLFRLGHGQARRQDPSAPSRVSCTNVPACCSLLCLFVLFWGIMSQMDAACSAQLEISVSTQSKAGSMHQSNSEVAVHALSQQPGDATLHCSRRVCMASAI